LSEIEPLPEDREAENPALRTVFRSEFGRNALEFAGGVVLVVLAVALFVLLYYGATPTNELAAAALASAGIAAISLYYSANQTLALIRTAEAYVDSLELSAFTEVILHIGNQEARDARKTIREYGPMDELRNEYVRAVVAHGGWVPPPNFDPPDLPRFVESQARLVVTMYDRVGMILDLSPGLKRKFIRELGDGVGHAWFLTGSYVHYRWRTGFELDYARRFEDLSKIAVNLNTKRYASHAEEAIGSKTVESGTYDY
jgi:hypothetical protein